MRLLLVNPPWGALETASLGLGILRRKALDTLPDAEVEVRYANLTFADWMLQHTGLNILVYNYLAKTTYLLGVGDWVFSSALYDDPTWREDEFLAARRHLFSEDRLHQLISLHRAAPRFIAEQAEQIVARQPDLVGFTSTFQQNTAALALRAIWYNWRIWH